MQRECVADSVLKNRVVINEEAEEHFSVMPR